MMSIRRWTGRTPAFALLAAAGLRVGEYGPGEVKMAFASSRFLLSTMATVMDSMRCPSLATDTPQQAAGLPSISVMVQGCRHWIVPQGLMNAPVLG